MAASLLVGGCALAALGSVIGAAAVAPDEAKPTTWRAVDATTGQIQETAGLEQLASDFPDSASVRLRLATAYIRDENRAGARQQIDWLLARDYAFGAAGVATLAAFFEDFDPALAERLSRAPTAIARSEVFATIPAGARLIESIVRLPDNRWLVGSIVDRTAYVTRSGGDLTKWDRLALPGLGSVSGMVVDVTDATVWMASGVYDPTPDPASALRGLVGLKYDDLYAGTKIAAGVDATPSDLALARDGTLYASDPLNGRIYRAGRRDGELGVLVPAGVFRSPQGLVPLDSGKRLLISDYRYGLALIDIGSGAVSRVSTDLPFALDGFDGMWAYGDEVVAVQNGISPKRIVAFRLNGTKVVAARIVEIDHPDWTEPLGGTVVGNDFYYVANGQWSRFGKGGVATTDAPPLATEIRRVSLRR